jgi:hypothetical protein
MVVRRRHPGRLSSSCRVMTMALISHGQRQTGLPDQDSGQGQPLLMPVRLQSVYHPIVQILCRTLADVVEFITYSSTHFWIKLNNNHRAPMRTAPPRRHKKPCKACRTPQIRPIRLVPPTTSTTIASQKRVRSWRRRFFR